MLSQPLTHPDMLAALAAAGHGSTVLIADGNYPHATAVGANARRIYLNLRPGMINVEDILSTLVSTVAIERAQVMNSASGQEPAVFAEFRALLPGIELEGLERQAFYDAACSRNLAVAIASGDVRHNANLLLTLAALPEPISPEPAAMGVGAAPSDSQNRGDGGATPDGEARGNGSGAAVIA